MLSELFSLAQNVTPKHKVLEDDLPGFELRPWLFQEYSRKTPTAKLLSFLKERGASQKTLEDAERTIFEMLISQKNRGPLLSPPDQFFNTDLPAAVFAERSPSIPLHNPDVIVKKIAPGITVYDNFLSEEGFKALSHMVDESGFYHGKYSNSRHHHIEVGLWFRSFLGQTDTGRRLDVARSGLIAKMPLINDLWTHSTYLTGAKNLVRAYANGYTYGTDATAHRDDSIIYRTGTHLKERPATILFYLNEEWNRDWAGETTFFDEEGEIIASVLPKRNRVCVFDGTIQHGARPVSRYCYPLRKIFVFKTAPFTEHGEDDAIAVMLNASRTIKHSGGLFSDHLIATSAILAKLGAPKYLCDAALYHSAYGTSYFPVEINFTREALVQLIGEQAERLVDIFCKTETRIPSIIENRGGWDDEIHRDLLLIEYANLIEQEPRMASITEKGYITKIIVAFKEKYGVDLPSAVNPWKKDQ